MKWLILTMLAVMVLVPISASARNIKNVYTGPIPRVESNQPETWAIAGHNLITIRTSQGDMTPYMRTALMDARLVAILDRTNAAVSPIQTREVNTVVKQGHQYIVIRDYLLTEVTNQDAQATGMSKAALARQWVASLRRALPDLIAPPKPSSL